MKKVAFQGERGAYSEEVIYQHFGPEVETVPCRRFEEIFAAVESGSAEYGALPVENSTAGSINRAYDLLLQHDLGVWGEAILRVRHALLAPPGTTLSSIQRVRSHPQALAQCERYLSNRGWLAETVYDTAGSARDLAANPEPGVAAIASRLAGQIYGLDELDYGIEDAFYNYTRFFILSERDAPRAERCKTSIVFSARHQPGTLYESMGEFARRSINLTKIESRPRLNRPWQYVFYLDFEGHCEDPDCEAALMGLLRRSSFLKLLGSYPAATMPEANGANSEAPGVSQDSGKQEQP
jgi:prephenate dehydratase